MTQDRGREKKEALLSSMLYKYAVNMWELNSGLSRSRFQRPLRESIDFLLRYVPIVGEADAKKLAANKFITLVSRTVNKDLDVKKEGGETSYRETFWFLFNDIADMLLLLRRRLHPDRLMRDIEALLDIAYELYKHAMEEK